MFYNQDDLIGTMNTAFATQIGEIIDYDNTSRFFTPEEGFLRGNMFKEEYKPYKNLTFLKITSKDEKEALLFKVSAFDFAILDLGLHLDLYPEDEEVFDLFKIYISECENLKSVYERTYGPLCLDNTKGIKYSWGDEPWPWDKDKGGMNYV